MDTVKVEMQIVLMRNESRTSPKEQEMNDVVLWYQKHLADVARLSFDGVIKSVKVLYGSTIEVVIQANIFNEDEDEEELLGYVALMLSDPDDDGNYPLNLRGKKYLVVGEETYASRVIDDT